MPTRKEHDSMGDIDVPSAAFYGAQTQRAFENFTISRRLMPVEFIQALLKIKWACAIENRQARLLSDEIAMAIIDACKYLIDASQEAGFFATHFPVPVFQTGSATSSNMNVNEVVAHIASRNSGLSVHPNDHVNKCQSSNDTVPSAIHVSCYLQIKQRLMPAISGLIAHIEKRAQSLQDTTKTGRTHLMDALPITLGQELSAWSAQLSMNLQRIDDGLKRLSALPQGGTAVGTGINAPEKFGARVAVHLSEITSVSFRQQENLFAGLAAQDTAVEISGHLNTFAVTLTKIANDLRWMNSGPLAGLGEIQLPALQPGSSIMPGKVNPVIPEAVAMAMAQVMGHHTTITFAGQSGNFQLNVMLPLIATNLLEAIELISSSADCLAEKVMDGFIVNDESLTKALASNPVLVTALNPLIGYDRAAAIAKTAYRQKRPIIDVAREMTDLDEETLQHYLNPVLLTQGGLGTDNTD